MIRFFLSLLAFCITLGLVIFLTDFFTGNSSLLFSAPITAIQNYISKWQFYSWAHWICLVIPFLFYLLLLWRLWHLKEKESLYGNARWANRKDIDDIGLANGQFFKLSISKLFFCALYALARHRNFFT